MTAGVVHPRALLVFLTLAATMMMGSERASGAPASPIDVDVTCLTVAARSQTQSGPTCLLLGKPWVDYSRGLLQISLEGLQAEEFEKVARAVLTLQVEVHANPQDLDLEIGAVTVPWDGEATWGSYDGETGWPGGNMDNALDPETISSYTLPQGGTLDVDLTGILDAWLFQGRPNYGLLLRMGPTVHGLPDAGSWEVTLSQPTLQVELAGPPPTIGDQRARTLRHYPSALLPPVREPYLFYWEFGTPPDYPGRVANTFGSTWQVQRKIGSSGSSESQGMLPLKWFFGPNNPYLPDEQAFADSYIRTAQSRTLAIMVDEWQSVGADAEAEPHALHPDEPFGLTGSMRGMIEAKEINPSFYITVAWRGEDNIWPEALAATDMLLLESYTHMHTRFPQEWAIGVEGVKGRIDTARKNGMIERTIPWIGHIHMPEEYHPGHVLTAWEIERQVMEYRRYAPEMPGLAFYANTNEELARAADQIARRYFIDPAPDVRFTAPAFEATLRHPRVALRVKATGQEGRAIRRYDWFVDNRLVAQTTTEAWVWDTRDVEAGYHLLTVHAVDEDWNRSAAQIPVRVER